MRMGAVGLVGTGGRKTTQKICTNGRVGQYLVTHDHGKKIRLTLGLPKKQTETVINIILGGQGLQRALV